MTVTPLVDLDIPATASRSTQALGHGTDFAHALEQALGSAGDALERADRSEAAFAAGRGGLQEMVLERARAEVALSLASATTTHVAQSLQTILGMQV